MNTSSLSLFIGFIVCVFLACSASCGGGFTVGDLQKAAAAWPTHLATPPAYVVVKISTTVDWSMWFMSPQRTWVADIKFAQVHDSVDNAFRFLEGDAWAFNMCDMYACQVSGDYTVVSFIKTDYERYDEWLASKTARIYDSPGTIIWDYSSRFTTSNGMSLPTTYVTTAGTIVTFED